MADTFETSSTSQTREENFNRDNTDDETVESSNNLPTPPTKNTSHDEQNTQATTLNSADDQVVEIVEEFHTEVKNTEVGIEKTEHDDLVAEKYNAEQMSNDALDDADKKCGPATDNSRDSDSENQLALKVELPPKDSEKVNTTETKSETVKNVVDGACGNSGRQSDMSDESIHQIKWVHFKNKQVPIMTQNENGPCPLLSLINVLLLQNRLTLSTQSGIVSASQLMAHLGDSVLQNVPGEDGVSTHSRLNFEQNMGDAMAVMYKLQTGLDVNVRFTGVRDFEYTSECIIFDLLQIPLYHGWLVDPQNTTEVEAMGTCSYNQLVEKIIVQKSSEQHELVSQALVAEQFLESSAAQLTYHGLCELGTQLKEDELAVLFRNNHFNTLYRHKGELFQLVTDQGFLHESNVVWETLSNVEGDCHFVDSEFRTYTKPEPPPMLKEPSNVAVNSEEQIDHDYLVALSLQQEQQSTEQNAWTPQRSDEELAKQLQEEERRAAMAEAGETQRRPGQPAPRQQGQQPSSQRRPERGQHREEKKSDCCIL